MGTSPRVARRHQIKRVESLTRVIHSNFVPNITMGAPILSCVRDNVPDIFMDCHMMVADPAKVGRVQVSIPWIGSMRPVAG
jgi:pentose-5-phosphate-3-epimerase